MTTATTEAILQEVFILATGRAANANEIATLGTLKGNGDFAPLINLVNVYMSGLQQQTSTNQLVRTVALNGMGMELTEAEAAPIAAAIEAGTLTWADGFIACITRTDSHGRTLDNRAEAADTFLASLAAQNKSAYFTGTAINAAVKNLIQNIGAGETSLANGQNGLDSLVANLTATGVRSSVVDGYVKGATVFVDANGDGIFNPGEFSTVTDDFGNYVLPSDATVGRIVASGGVDIMTGNPFQGVLTAPAGSTVINPLTTLVEALVSSGQASNLEAATQAVQQSLGLPSDINLLSYDPLTVLADTTASAAEKSAALSIQASALQVANIITLAANAIHATDTGTPLLQAADSVIAAVAGLIATNSGTGSGVNLADTTTLAGIIENAASTPGGSNVPASLVAQLAQIAAASNAATENAGSITELAQIATVAQGDTTDEIITALGSGTSLASVVDQFTGNALNTAIDNADVGQILPGVDIPDPTTPTTPGDTPQDNSPPPAPGPSLTGSSPADNGTLEYDHDIILTFDVDVSHGTGSVGLYNAADDSLVESFDVAAGTGSAGGSISFGKNGNSPTVTINPFANLVDGSNYYVQVGATAIQDNSNHYFSGITGSTALDFSAVDSAPTLTSTLPSVGGSLEVDQEQKIYLGFDQTIQAGTGNISLYNAADDSLVESFDIASGIGSSGGTLSFSSGKQGATSILLDLHAGLAAGSNYYIKVDASAIKDSTDHYFYGIDNASTFHFTAVDSAPKLSSSYPADNGTLDIDQMRILHLYFDQYIQAGTGHIALYDAANDSLLESYDVVTGIGSAGGALIFNDYDCQIGVGSAVSLIVGGNYYLRVDGTAIADTSGNNFAGISDNTTLNFTVEDDAPALASSFPADNGTLEIDQGQNISLTFDQNVQAGSGAISLYDAANDSLVESFDVATGAGSAGGSISFGKIGSSPSVTIAPAPNLVAGTHYYVHIDATAVKDNTDHYFAGIGDDTTLDFSVVDNAPELASTSPADNGSAEVDLTQNISLTFDQNVQAGTGTISLYDAANNSLVESFDVVTGIGSAGGSLSFGKSGSSNTVTVDPYASLVGGNGYYVKVDATAVKDATDHYFAGIDDASTFNFSAVDNAPSLASTNPANNGSINIDQGKNIYLYFDQTVQAGTGSIDIYSAADDSLVESFNVVSGIGSAGGALSISDSQVTLAPSASLAGGNSYYVLADATAIRDGAGHYFAGIDDKTSFDFTAIDNAPTLSSTYPSDNGTIDIEYDQDIILTFDQTILAGTGAVSLYNATDDSLVESFDVATGVGSAGGTLVLTVGKSGTNGMMVDPYANLIEGAHYYVQVDSTAIKDSTIHYFAGIDDKTSFDFTAVDAAPTLSSTSPADNGTIEVGQDKDISLSFDQNVHAGSGVISLYDASNDSLVESFDVTTGIGSAGGSLSFGKGGGSSSNVVYLDPFAEPVTGANYYIHVDATALKDATNHYFAGISDNTTLSFSAIDSAPALTGSLPTDGGSIEVDQDQNLFFFFDQYIEAGSGNISIYSAADDSLVESFAVATGIGSAGGTLSFSGGKSGHTTVGLNPSANLTAGSRYYVHIDSTAIKDSTEHYFSGIDDDTTLNFSVVDDVPMLNNYSPTNTGTDVDVDSEISLDFNQYIQAGTGNIVISDGAGDTRTIDVTDSSQVTFNSSYIKINPTADLAAGATYSVTMASGVITDPSGHAFAGLVGTDYSFTTTAI